MVEITYGEIEDGIKEDLNLGGLFVDMNVLKKKNNELNENKKSTLQSAKVCT